MAVKIRYACYDDKIICSVFSIESSLKVGVYRKHAACGHIWKPHLDSDIMVESSLQFVHNADLFPDLLPRITRSFTHSQNRFRLHCCGRNVCIEFAVSDMWTQCVRAIDTILLYYVIIILYFHHIVMWKTCNDI